MTDHVLLDEAFVCGRFQPPHNEHVDYLLQAKQRCRFLWVGIVMPDERTTSASTHRHRHEPHSNPLTYFERVQIITRALIDAGVRRTDFACTPFPLDVPKVLANYMPCDIPCFTTACGDWNEEKTRLLQSAGYRVEVLLSRRDETRLHGRVIREAIVRGDPVWEGMVPPATKEAVYRLGLRDRLLSKGLQP